MGRDRDRMAALRRGLTGARPGGPPTDLESRSIAEDDGAEVVRQRLWTDRRDEMDPFDIVGDVHGCADNPEALLLGYAVERTSDVRESRHWVTPPSGRKASFLGDLVVRGSRVAFTLRIVMNSVEEGAPLFALAIPGRRCASTMARNGWQGAGAGPPIDPRDRIGSCDISSTPRRRPPGRAATRYASPCPGWPSPPS